MPGASAGFANFFRDVAELVAAGTATWEVVAPSPPLRTPVRRFPRLPDVINLVV